MSKEDELAKELVEVVPNTYGDLHDAPVEYIEILSSGKVGETKTIPQDTVITSLDDLLSVSYTHLTLPTNREV